MIPYSLSPADPIASHNQESEIMSMKKDAEHRRKIRRRKQSKLGSVLPILLAADLAKTECREATEDDIPIVWDMIATMMASGNGVGLAAPQVGCNVRIAVMKVGKQAPPIILVNPIIVMRSIETVTASEGCLSEPGRFVDVLRHAAIWVKWRNEDGAEYRASWTGFEARIIQHEIDHLNGFCKVLDRPADDMDPA